MAKCRIIFNNEDSIDQEFGSAALATSFANTYNSKNQNKIAAIHNLTDNDVWFNMPDPAKASPCELYNTDFVAVIDEDNIKHMINRSEIKEIYQDSEGICHLTFVDRGGGYSYLQIIGTL